MEYSKSVAKQVTEVIDMKYVNRGDLPGSDFSFMPAANVWTDLDLSGVIPAPGANHLAHLKVESIAGAISFREKGNINTVNTADTQPTSFDGTDLWLIIDANRKIQYFFAEPPPADTVNISVRGYWTD